MKATLAIEFDTTIKRDASKLEQISNILNDNNISSSTTSQYASNNSAYELSRQIAELKTQKDDLEKQIGRYQAQAQKDNAKIESFKKALDEQHEEVKKLTQDISKKDEDIKEIEETYKKLIEEEEDRYRKLERDLKNELLFQSKEIKELKKKLEHYEPGGFNVGEEKFYYNELNNRLIETMDDKAPYIAQAIDKNKCRFHFNIVSGPIKEACSSNRNLLMYCDIINEEPNASNIMRDKWGIASLTDSGDLIVESNAKIKLTRI